MLLLRALVITGELKVQNKLEMNVAPHLLPLPLEKNQEGLYPVPTTRCGVLPFFIDKDNQIIWGCIESNRVGPKTVTPPAGIQDIIIMKAEHCFKVEVGKPFPDLQLDFLNPFIGKHFRDKNFQDIIACLIENAFDVYVENSEETALHETLEEHGVDLRNEGKDRHLLNTLFKLPLQTLSGKQGATAQCTYLAFLKNGEGINLSNTFKIENKIRRNLGRHFYEKGCWGTLESFKISLRLEKEQFKTLDKHTQYTSPQVDLIEGVLAANQDAIDFLEHLELLIKADLKKLAGGEILYQDSAQEIALDYQNSHDITQKLNAPLKADCVVPILVKQGIFNFNPSMQKEQVQKNQDNYLGFNPGFIQDKSF